jgi:hypothetical protein
VAVLLLEIHERTEQHRARVGVDRISALHLGPGSEQPPEGRLDQVLGGVPVAAQQVRAAPQVRLGRDGVDAELLAGVG